MSEKCLCGECHIHEVDSVSGKVFDDKKSAKRNGFSIPFGCKKCDGIVFPYEAVRDVIVFFEKPLPEKIGSIHLPEGDEFRGGGPKFRLREVGGIVLSAGPGYVDKKRIFRPSDGIEVGDEILFHSEIHSRGHWKREVENMYGDKVWIAYCGYQDVLITY